MMHPRHLEEGKLVRIDWEDAMISLEYDEDDTTVTASTYGVIVKVDQAHVVIAGETCTQGTYRHLTYIPIGMVRAVAALS